MAPKKKTNGKAGKATSKPTTSKETVQAEVIIPDKPSPFTKDYHPVRMADPPERLMPEGNAASDDSNAQAVTKLIAKNAQKGIQTTPDTAALKTKCRGMKEKMRALKEQLSEADKEKFHTVRPALSTTTAKTLISNHFKLDIEPNISIYHYTVTMLPKKDDGQTLNTQQMSGFQSEVPAPDEDHRVSQQPSGIALQFLDKDQKQIIDQPHAGLKIVLLEQTANATPDTEQFSNVGPAARQPSNTGLSKIPTHSSRNAATSLMEEQSPLVAASLAKMDDLATGYAGDVPGDNSGDSFGDNAIEEPLGKVDGRGCSKALKKMVISQVLTDCAELRSNSKNFATDFVATIVSWKELFKNKKESDKHVWQGTVALRPEADKDRKLFEVRIVREQTVLLDNFVDYINAKADPTTIICNTTHVARLLNLFVSRHVYQNAMDATIAVDIDAKSHAYQQLRRKYFSVKDTTALMFRDCGDVPPLLAMRGFWTNVVPGFGSAYLNVNIGASPFYSTVTVSQFLQYFHNRGMLPQAQRMLTRVRVYIDWERTSDSLNAPSARIKTIQGWGVHDQTFVLLKKKEKTEDPDEVEDLLMPVRAHLQTTHGWSSPGDAELPCVNIGGSQKGKENWIIPDALRILPYQPFNGQLHPDFMTDMINFARQHPAANQNRIIDFGEKALGLSALVPTKNQFVSLMPGVTISHTLAKHVGGRLDPPTISYAASEIAAGTTKWNLKKMNFVDVPTKMIKIYGVIASDAGGAPAHIAELKKALAECGMRVHADIGSTHSFQAPSGHQQANDRDWEAEIDAALTAIEGDVIDTVDTAKFVVLMLRAKEPKSRVYAYFKRSVDMVHGLPSGCITHCIDLSRAMRYFANVAMKANLKFPASAGGEPSRNHVIRGMDDFGSSLVIGAGVTHPGQSCVYGTPSIAAVIGSADMQLCHYTGSMKLQAYDPLASSTEIIPRDSMREMVKQCMRSHVLRQESNELPTQVIFYRDGVSEGQYAAFKKEEVEAIQEAYAAIRLEFFGANTYVDSPTKKKDEPSEKIPITAIVAEKRHHTRFYPEEVETGNCPPGTVVETGPTSSIHFDFFLQAHNGIIGIVKPTHYYVVRDDSNFSADQLLKFTNQLSYLYQRATLPVSYVTPTYYAHHLAGRGRKYLKPFLDGNVEDVCRLYLNFTNSPDVSKVRVDLSVFGDQRSFLEALESSAHERHGDAGRLVKQAADCAFRSGVWRAGRTSERGPWHEGLDKTMFWL